VNERPVDKLRRAVISEGGEWTAKRAAQALNGAYRSLREDGTYGSTEPTPYRARLVLDELVDEGLLVKHGKIGRLWTLTDVAEQKHREGRCAP
jgi:hypothetical protein